MTPDERLQKAVRLAVEIEKLDSHVQEQAQELLAEFSVLIVEGEKDPVAPLYRMLANLVGRPGPYTATALRMKPPEPGAKKHGWDV